MVNFHRFFRAAFMLLLAVKAFLLNPVYAINDYAQISNVLTDAAGGLGRVMYGISFVAGVGFLLAGLLQYKHHRDNPQMVRISTVLTYFALGLALVALPFIAMISDASFATR